MYLMTQDSVTSIITYVDLLKNEGVESDTQKEYMI